MTKLDEIDVRLLEMLQQDGRATIRALADDVGLPESTTRDRIRALEESGIIHGYHADVDARKLGLELIAWVFVDISHHQSAEFNEFLARQPAVIRGHAMAHKPDAYAVKVAAKSTATLNHMLTLWRKRFEFRVRDVLLLSDVYDVKAVAEERQSEELVLSALDEKV